MPNETPRITPTNSSEENHGQFLGIELPKLIWVMMFLMLGFGVFGWLQYRRGVSLSAAFWIILLPAALCGLYIAIFLQGGKHPSYASDVLESLASQGNAQPPAARCSSGWPGQPPDGFFVNNLIVLNGAGPGGQVVKGFWLEVPDLANASEGEKNALNAKIQRLFLLFPENIRIAVDFSKDSNLRDPLTRYQERVCANPAIQRLRNLNFLRLWEMMLKGELRRHRVAIFLGRELDRKARVPWRRNPAERHYEAVLGQCQVEFAEYAQALVNLLSSMGGSAIPMTDADHYKLFLEKLNPSLAQRNGFDPMPGFDCTKSILDNCWHSEIRGLGGRGFWLDEMRHGVLVLKHWPLQTTPGVIRWLTHLPFGDYTITVHIRRFPARRLVRKLQRALDRINRQLVSKTDEHLSVTKAQLELRIQRLLQESEVPLLAEITVVLKAPTPEILTERMLATKSAIHAMRGAQYHDASLAASSKNWFFKTLPGAMWNRHQGLTLYGESSFVADMLPLISSFNAHLSSAEAIYVGTHGNLIGIKTFSGDGEHAMPMNMLVFGAPGMGKSVVICDLLFQTAAFFEFTVIIEEGQSHVAFTQAMGCVPIIVRVGGSQSLNIMDSQGLPMSPSHQSMIVAFLGHMVGLPSDADQASYRLALIAKHLRSMLREFAQDRLHRLSEPARTNLVRRALNIHRLAVKRDISFLDAFIECRDGQLSPGSTPPAGEEESGAATLWEFQSKHGDLVEDLIFSMLSSQEQPTLSSLREHLELNGNGPEGAHCQQIATLLEPYCGDGRYGSIFDRPTNVSLNGQVVHLELGSISDADKQLKELLRFAVLLLVRQLFLTLPKLARKRILIEELSRFLDLGGESIVRELWEQMRKYSVQNLGILQQFSRITNASLRAALIGCTPSFFIFNPGDRTDLAVLAGDIGLSPAAQETILRYARPSQLAGRKYSEFCYVHLDPHHPICGTVRHFQLSERSESVPQTLDSHE